jgi:serine/threonine protein kinase
MLQNGDRLGRYDIVGALASGGMGEVYRARDPQLERDVAIKVLPSHVAANAESLRRLKAEAKALAALSHPNIMAVFDVGECNGCAFITTELLEGESIRSLLLRGPVPWQRAVELSRDVATALSATHLQGIRHRDIKPENLFLTRNAVIKTIDFGLARQGPPQCSKGRAPSQ